MGPTTIGTIQLIATIDTSQYKRGAKEIERANSEMEGSTEKLENKQRTLGRVGAAALGAIGGAAFALASKGIASITSSVSSAIRRVDTLNNSARTFENMGFSVDVSKKAVQDLTDSILGLPTPLDSAINGMTGLAATYGDISRGQKVFTALNNSILGFGGTAAMVENAILQLSQIPLDGPLDAQTWRSLRNSGLTPVLVAMAKESGMSVDAMKTAFGEGQLTVEDFTNKLIEMNTKGGGGLKSLDKIARDSTKGIGTGFANMQTAITRGMANIINAVGSKEISESISAIGSGIERFLTLTSQIITTIIQGGKEVTQWFDENRVLVMNLSIVIGTLLLPQIVAIGVRSAIAFGIYIAQLSTALIATSGAAIKMAASWLLAFGPIGLITAAVVGLTALIIANWDTVRDALTAFWGWLGTSASNAWGAVKSVFSGIGSFFNGIINSIVGFFGNIGTRVGNAIGGAFKAVINTVLRGAIGIINGFIDAINFAIDVINYIPGVDIGKLGRLNVPQLAEGGIVSKATLAVIGEGSEPEAVIPLSKLDAMLNGNGGGGDSYNITINASTTMLRSENDKREFANMIIDSLNQQRNAKGLGPLS